MINKFRKERYTYKSNDPHYPLDINQFEFNQIWIGDLPLEPLYKADKVYAMVGDVCHGIGEIVMLPRSRNNIIAMMMFGNETFIPEVTLKYYGKKRNELGDLGTVNFTANDPQGTFIDPVIFTVKRSRKDIKK
jgi:hypothetical protein